MGVLEVAGRVRLCQFDHIEELALTNTPYTVVATQKLWGNEKRIEMEGWFCTDNGPVVVDGRPSEVIGWAVEAVAKLLSDPELLVYTSHRRCYAVKTPDPSREGWIVVAVVAATAKQAERAAIQFMSALTD